MLVRQTWRIFSSAPAPTRKRTWYYHLTRFISFFFSCRCDHSYVEVKTARTSTLFFCHRVGTTSGRLEPMGKKRFMHNIYGTAVTGYRCLIWFWRMVAKVVGTFTLHGASDGAFFRCVRQQVEERHRSRLLCPRPPRKSPVIARTLSCILCRWSRPCLVGLQQKVGQILCIDSS